jgi:hypothetical protein
MRNLSSFACLALVAALGTTGAAAGDLSTEQNELRNKEIIRRPPLFSTSPRLSLKIRR